MKIHFREHFFFYILTVLIVIVGVISYNRFIVKHDYIVGYKSVCDPTVNSCFVGCEDDACTEKYYYSKVVKYAADLYRQCGKDITGCKEANMCLTEDRNCSITYCDQKIDGNICENVIEEESSTVEENLEGVTANDVL